LSTNWQHTTCFRRPDENIKIDQGRQHIAALFGNTARVVGCRRPSLFETLYPFSNADMPDRKDSEKGPAPSGGDLFLKYWKK